MAVPDLSCRGLLEDLVLVKGSILSIGDLSPLDTGYAAVGTIVSRKSNEFRCNGIVKADYFKAVQVILTESLEISVEKKHRLLLICLGTTLPSIFES